MRTRSRTNIDEVLRDFDAFGARVKSTAIPRALNTLAGQADFAVRKKIRDIYGMSTAQLAPYFDVVLASASNPEARIVAKGKGFPLALFHPRRTRDGIVVTIKGRSVLFPHAFIPSGLGSFGLAEGKTVFARGRYARGSTAAARRRKGRRKAGLSVDGTSAFRPSGQTMGRFAFGWGRFPITALRSSSAPDMLGNPDVLQAGQDRIDEQAAKIIAREFRAVLRGF